MNTQSTFSILLASALVVFAACGGDDDDDSSNPASGGSGGSAGSPGNGSYCVDKCVAHETGCGAPSPQADCETLCTQYNPYRSQVDCAMAVSCGDEAGLMACLPDLECKTSCVKHEKDCGDPNPDEGCSSICSQYRPTPSQVACAEGVSCGDDDGLITCVEGNHD